MNEKFTAVEWLLNEMQKTYIFNQDDFDMLKKAKQMEVQISEKYATFCIESYLNDLPIVKFKDWIKL